MFFSRLTSSFYFLTFTLILQTTGISFPLSNKTGHFSSCLSQENFTSSIPYEANVNELMSYLSYSVPPTGFGVGSIGQDPNQDHGSALCRGDVSSAVCKTCVVEAATEILKSCPYTESAIISYDYCLLKYSNEPYFGQINIQTLFTHLSEQNARDSYTFNQTTTMLLRKLASEAISTPKFYAAGEMELTNDHQVQSKKVYGMAQCTRDLSTSGCHECLGDIIGKLPSYCEYRQECIILTGISCNVRYDIYPFLNA